MESILRLDGKVALITGSSRGIGWASAKALAGQGATVLLNGVHDPEMMEDKARLLRSKFGVECRVFVHDSGDPESVKSCYQEIFSACGRLDVLVNNAGLLEDSLLGMVSTENMEKLFNTNSRAVILNMQYASRLMARAKGGSIVNMSSIVGRVGNEGQVVYGATKAAVIGATLSAAKELAPMNIRVNAIAPGFIDTDMTRNLPPGIYQERLKSIRMSRIGTPEDVARAVLFFASDLSAYVTGQVLGVDGGMLI